MPPQGPDQPEPSSRPALTIRESITEVPVTPEPIQSGTTPRSRSHVPTIQESPLSTQELTDRVARALSRQMLLEAERRGINPWLSKN